MISMLLFLDAATISVILGIAFFFVCLAAAFIAFKMLKKTVKMAVRMTIVAVILIVALLGSLAVFFFGAKDSSPSKDSPATQTPRKTR